MIGNNSAPLSTRFPLYGIVLVVLLGGGGVLLVLFGIAALVRWRRSRSYETLGEDKAVTPETGTQYI
jgi:hypothetical protein